MNEDFLAEMVVFDRRDAYERLPVLARSAEEWFGGPVELVQLEIGARRIDDALRFVAVGRYRPSATPQTSDGGPSGRLAAAAKWLGLTP